MASHHKIVGMYDDPHTARLNESVFAYAVREVYGSHKDSFKREKKRIQAKHGKDCPLLFLIVFNKMTYYFLIHVTICVTIYLLLGWASLKHHFIYAFLGLFYINFANYITHYGLVRFKDKSG